MSITRPITRSITRPITRSIKGTDLRTAVIQALFGNGEQGALYDPSDLTTLYQDSAGTTPVTADRDPVGRMEDLSGNGNHATQSTTSAKPLYRTDGTLHWLEFDGFDDFLVTANVDLTGAHQVLVCAGIRKLADDATRAVIEHSYASNGFGLFATPAAGTAQFFFASHGGTSNRLAAKNQSAPATAVVTGEADTQAPYSRIRVDGTQEDENLSAQGGGNYSNQPFGIGGRDDGNWFLYGRMYGLAVAASSYQTGDVESVERLMASKSGVTL